MQHTLQNHEGPQLGEAVARSFGATEATVAASGQVAQSLLVVHRAIHEVRDVLQPEVQPDRRRSRPDDGEDEHEEEAEGQGRLQLRRTVGLSQNV